MEMVQQASAASFDTVIDTCAQTIPILSVMLVMAITGPLYTRLKKHEKNLP